MAFQLDQIVTIQLHNACVLRKIEDYSRKTHNLQN